MPRAKRIRRRVRIVNERGLHARAAARFAELAEQFKADVTITSGGETVAATSIMGILMLAAACGTEVEIAATGAEARPAVDALASLVERGFGE